MFLTIVKWILAIAAVPTVAFVLIVAMKYTMYDAYTGPTPVEYPYCYTSEDIGNAFIVCYHEEPLAHRIASSL